MMGAFRQDLRHGLRFLARSPAFTALAVVTLAIGIGSTTTAFSVVNATLLRPLPCKDPDRLVMLWENDRRHSRDRAEVAPANFADWRDQSHSFDGMAALLVGQATLSGAGDPVRVSYAVVSRDFLPVLGVNPLLGRSFVAEDEQEAKKAVVLLNHGIWQRRFNGDPNTVGRTIGINFREYRVLGILPPGFSFPGLEVEVLRLMAFPPKVWARRDNGFLNVIARLRSGVSLEDARQEMESIAQRIGKHSSAGNNAQSVTVIPLRDQLLGDARAAICLLSAAVILVLLIACANVANLLLARATVRQREIAMRVALGAGRARIARQLLTEGLLLAVLGGAAGALVSVWGTRALVATGTVIGIPGLDLLRVDGAVLAFSSALTIVSGLLFSLAPALQCSRPDLNQALKEGGGTGTDRAGIPRLRGALVVAGIGISFVLLIGAGLFLNSFIRLRSIRPGFDPRHVLSFPISLPLGRYAEEAQCAEFFRRLFERLRALPGVQSVGGIDTVPMTWPPLLVGFAIEGSSSGSQETVEVGLLECDPGYFHTMGIPMLQGRCITEGDGPDAPGVVLINDALAKAFFPSETPIGKRIRLGASPDSPWRTVIGVVGNVRSNGLSTEPQPEVYRPSTQGDSSDMDIVVRTAGDPLAIAGAVRDLVHATDRNLPLPRISTLEEVVDESIRKERFEMLFLTGFAVLALILALVGIYGVMEYSVRQRTHEIGIRMSLGAQSRDVLRLVLVQGTKLILAGMALGLLGAFALTRALSGLLYGVRPADPITFVVVIIAFSAVALLACYIPARRATMVDPMTALRWE